MCVTLTMVTVMLVFVENIEVLFSCIDIIVATYAFSFLSVRQIAIIKLQNSDTRIIIYLFHVQKWIGVFELALFIVSFFAIGDKFSKSWSVNCSPVDFISCWINWGKKPFRIVSFLRNRLHPMLDKIKWHLTPDWAIA